MTSKYFDNKCVDDMKRAVKRKKPNEKDHSVVKISKQSNDVEVSKSALPNHPSVVMNSGGISSKLGRTFYDVPCATLARNLLGQHIVRMIGAQKIRGRIVETEAYIGPTDKAAHSYQGKKTPRNEAMFMCPGTCYVYNIYGMYCCINISSQGDGAAVLIRAVEPIEGLPLMEKGRGAKAGQKNKPLKEKDLANGPSKLCQAFHISKNDFNKTDLTLSDSLWLENGERMNDKAVVSCPRINIGYADDWVDKPLRFYVLGNTSVSVKDKKAELVLKSEQPSSEKSTDV